MAYDSNELYSSNSVDASKRAAARKAKVVTLASSVGAETLEKLTPLAYDTSVDMWKVWTNGGSNGTGTVRAFLWPDEVTLDAANEVLGQALWEGEVHIDDVEVPDGENLANLKAAIQSPPSGPTLRELGIHVRGLDKIS